jgi:hypothetical protein
MPAALALRTELAGATVGEELATGGIGVGDGVVAALLGGATLGPPPITSQPHSSAPSTRPPSMPRSSIRNVRRRTFIALKATGSP